MRKDFDFVTITRYFALVVGLAFVAAGVAGFIPFFTPPASHHAPALILNANYGLLLGLFPVNILHNIFHFGVGVFGILAFRNYTTARLFSRFLGITLSIFTIMGFFPVLNVGFGLWPLYGHDIWLHGLEAVIGLYLGYFVNQNTFQVAQKVA